MASHDDMNEIKIKTLFLDLQLSLILLKYVQNIIKIGPPSNMTYIFPVLSTRGQLIRVFNFDKHVQIEINKIKLFVVISM